MFEDRWSILEKKIIFAIRVWFQVTPPPTLVKDHTFTFFWDPSLSLVVCVSVIKRDFWCPKYSKIDWCPGTLLLPFKKDGA